MCKFAIIFAAFVACAAAKPGLLAPTAFVAAPAVGYVNAPLYAAGGSTQIDVRHNYDGTLSSYTTAPFNYVGPNSSRYVAGAPGSIAAPAHFAGHVHFPAPAVAAGPGVLAAPARYLAPAGIASGYGVPHGTQYASPFAAQFASPYTSYATGAFASHAV